MSHSANSTVVPNRLPPSSKQIASLQFVSASIAACMAVTITHPFDVLKTRRQLQNELIESKLLDVTKTEKITLRSIWKWEGVSGIYRGLQPAYIYQILMNGVRFGTYEPLRLELGREVKRISGAQEWVQVPCNIISGATAGVLGATIGSPFNLIKTRLQSFSPHFSTGYQHNYAGLIDAIRRIYSSPEGISGFYHGISAAMVRTAVGSAVQLSSYDFCKSLALPLGIAQGNIGVHFIAALTSGLLVCTAMNPFDVIMTRLFNQSSVRGEKLYRGLWDCAVKTIRVEGFRAMFKGFSSHYIRIGPHTMLNLMFLEQVRSLLAPVFI